MNKRIAFIFVNVLFCCAIVNAQQESSASQPAAAEQPVMAPGARTLISAYRNSFNQGKHMAGVQSGVAAARLQYEGGNYKSAFEILRDIDHNISALGVPGSTKSAMHYYTSKERMKMYMRMHRPVQALDHLKIMDSHAAACNVDSVKNDILYNKTIYYYTVGQNTKGNEVFEEMASKLTAAKEYDKIDEVYRQLIASGRRSNSASLVAQSYRKYMDWKDSTNVIRHADEVKALKKQIADNEAVIAEQDSSLTMRQAIIIGLAILACVLAAVLVIGAIALMRFILLTRKQQKTIQLANENNALKAKFIGNISAQLEPTLAKLDKSNPNVKALLDFSTHIQLLSSIENSIDEDVETEEVQIQPFCESLMEPVHDKVSSDITLKVNAPKMSINMNREYVEHILKHLLFNAAEYVGAEGTITLEYKKRGAHSHQFLVSNTGEPIPEEKRDDIFKPFLEIRDLTKGDGLGLPTCKQMALKMKGDLEIDPEFTKGTRFILELHD